MLRRHNHPENSPRSTERNNHLPKLRTFPSRIAWNIECIQIYVKLFLCSYLHSLKAWRHVFIFLLIQTFGMGDTESLNHYAKMHRNYVLSLSLQHWIFFSLLPLYLTVILSSVDKHLDLKTLTYFVTMLLSLLYWVYM